MGRDVIFCGHGTSQYGIAAFKSQMNLAAILGRAPGLIFYEYNHDDHGLFVILVLLIVLNRLILLVILNTLTSVVILPGMVITIVVLICDASDYTHCYDSCQCCAADDDVGDDDEDDW